MIHLTTGYGITDGLIINENGTNERMTIRNETRVQIAQDAPQMRVRDLAAKYRVTISSITRILREYGVLAKNSKPIRCDGGGKA